MTAQRGCQALRAWDCFGGVPLDTICERVFMENQLVQLIHVIQ